MRVFRVLTIWTFLLHLPWATSVALALRVFLGWGSVVVGLVAWLLPVWMLFRLVFDTMPDRHRSRWRVDLLERPYMSHWVAAHFCALGWIPGLSICWSLSRTDLWIIPLAAYALALIVFGWGAFVTARRLRVRTIDLPIEELPLEYAGYRILHLSDLHVGSFCPPTRVGRWLDRVSSIPCDLVVVTGDLLTSGTMFHGDVVALLGRLNAPNGNAPGGDAPGGDAPDGNAPDGVVCVPGNHDYFGDSSRFFQNIQAQGVRVLRNECFTIGRGEAILTVAGVDDSWTGRTDIDVALRGCGPGVSVLLAHDPAVFDDAASRGVDVVLSGHTHGGQIAVPWLARYCNIAKFANPYSYGVYRRGRSTLVVNGGMGCTGVPIRVGVPPEVLLIRLQRVSAVE